MAFHNSFKKDLEFGLSKEEPIRQLLEDYFKDDLTKTNNYCKFDFEGTSKKKYELKSRTNKKQQYPTTIIPKHKINKETINNGLIFVFNFTDKCCYIEYDEEVFNNFQIKTFKINRTGKYDPPTDHYLIPVNLLIDIN